MFFKLHDMYRTGSCLVWAQRYFPILTDQQMQKRGSGNCWQPSHVHLSAHRHTRIQTVNCSLLRRSLSQNASPLASQRRLRRGKLGYSAALVLTVQASLGGDKDSNWLGLNESEEEDWLPSTHFFFQQAPPSLIMTTLRPIKCVWTVMGKSHWEVLAPFAKAAIMRGCEGPRSTRDRCRQAGW